MLIDAKFHKQDIKHVKDSLRESEKYNHLAKFILGDYWLEGMTDKEVIELGNALHELHLEIEVTLIYKDTDEPLMQANHFENADDSELLEYSFNDIQKKMFIVIRSRMLDTEKSVTQVIDTLVEADKFESQIGTSILYINEEEIIELIDTLYQGQQLLTLHRKVSLLSRYSTSYSGTNIEVWEKHRPLRALGKLVGVDQKISDSAMKNLLEGYFAESENPQSAIIPILIFEGVKLSTIDEDDELRFIKTHDIYPNGIMLRGNSKDSKGRFIQLDETTMSAVRIASAQTIYRGAVKRSVDVPFLETGYLIKPTIDSNNQNGVMGYQGALKKYKLFQSEVKDIPNLPNMTVTKMREFGKVYNINSLLANGAVLDSALVSTLQRFDDFEFTLETHSDEEKSIIYENNRSRIYRLHSLWVAYGGDADYQED